MVEISGVDELICDVSGYGENEEAWPRRLTRGGAKTRRRSLIWSFLAVVFSRIEPVLEDQDADDHRRLRRAAV